MQTFKKRVNKILSPHTLNQKDYIQFKTVSHQQFKKNKLQMINKIKEKKKENNKYFLRKEYQNKIKKFNNNLFLLRKIILQNKKICQVLKDHKKIKEKSLKIVMLQRILANFQDLTIFLDDIDENIIDQIINKG